MVTPIGMPRLGNTVEECLLAKWRQQKGDRVAEGEVIADIETDKAACEIVAPSTPTAPREQIDAAPAGPAP